MDEKVIALPAPERGVKFTPFQAMQLAIDEAAKGLPFVSPNPAVGCVVLDADGGFLSSGYHQKYGEAHAEVNAVKGLSETDLQQAQVYVTLEPCAHQGKTPSCARMLAKHPLQRVVYGLRDPNPLVSGKGAQILREAGIDCMLFHECAGPGLEAELEEVCEAFLWNQRHNRLFVSLKVAASLDGKIALASGESKWITGAASREFAHWLRASHDATLIGVGTLLRDDPALDIRHPEIQKTNQVVVLDSQAQGLRRSDELKMIKTHRPENLF
jgi:diaminohydroxyphosphoribosylaminopyrimidine deaminase/5-amino-6-(5-phosphoribosylamino)uracil reductase